MQMQTSPSRSCKIHNVELPYSDAKCVQCAARLMKAAAKELERRVAQLEGDQMRTCNFIRSNDLVDGKKKSSRREPSMQPRTIRSNSIRRQNLRSRSTQPRRIRSDTIPQLDKVQLKESTPDKLCFSDPSLIMQMSCDPIHQFHLGEAAQDGVTQDNVNNRDTLIKIARLGEGSGAFVLRSDNVWTYATLKSREGGPDACLVFTVSERGDTKRFPVSRWAKCIRLVAVCPLIRDHTAPTIAVSEIQRETETMDLSADYEEEKMSSTLCLMESGHLTSLRSNLNSIALRNKSEDIVASPNSAIVSSSDEMELTAIKTVSCDLQQVKKEHHRIKHDAHSKSCKSNTGRVNKRDSFFTALKRIHSVEH